MANTWDNSANEDNSTNEDISLDSGKQGFTRSLLGTQPISHDDNKSHHLIYRYTIPSSDPDDSSSPPDLTQAVPRESVLDFFYPHTLATDGEETPKESLDKLKMRRDVFLLAFSAVQALDADDRWSYYQIAGIHGLPHAPYDGDDGEWDPYNPEWWGGYCQHGTPLFPTWHRPYMLLLEQSIIRQAKLLATTLSNAGEKEAVSAMAGELRIPYWDWASNSARILGLPDIFTSTDVSLAYAWKSFTRTSIPNPLKAFVVPRDVGKPFASSDVYNPSARPGYVVPPQGNPFLPKGYPTVRHVTPNYASNNDKVNVSVMRNAGTALVEGVHAMLQHDQWMPFSNHFWSEATHGDGTQFGYYASLELVHDFVHGMLGGAGGQMSYPEIASFDPIFFFHHANVDRLVALWQYCYPDAWIPDTPLQLNHDGTYILPPNSESLATTELTPFRLGPNDDAAENQQRKFVTSNDVRLVDRDCGYSYPEILTARKAGWTPARMVEYLRKLYKPPQDYTHRWILVLDRVEKRVFNGTFQIRVFLGNPNANAATPINSPNYAGSMTVFARSIGMRCANCDERKYMRASLDLTKTMVRLGITTVETLSATADPFAPPTGRLAANPLSAPGSITLVFVSLTGQQLDTSAVVGDGVEDGVQLALYYQRGIPDESINEFFVRNLNIAPTTIAKFVLPA